MPVNQNIPSQPDTGLVDQANADLSSVSRIPFYFGPEGKRLFGWLHIVESKPIYDTGVVICPSLGVEYMNAHRPLRYTADYFALAGIPAIRFDYHGTGDSSGLNEDEDRLEDWLWSIDEAQKELKRLTGCQKIGLFGFRVGAMFASLISEKLESDFLVLWAPLESGRRYIREIKALQMASEIAVEHAEESFIEAGGAVFFQQTASDIGKIDLLKLKPKTNRILIIPRDDLPVKNKLKNSWQNAGLNVMQLELSGFADMVIDPHYVKIPHKTISEIVAWANDGSSEREFRIGKKNELASLSKQIKLAYYNGCFDDIPKGECSITERVFNYGPDNKRVAILSEPLFSVGNKMPVIILANSGSNHRVGPNRLYVLLARDLSHKGFRCLRVDVDGLGDSVILEQEKENIVYMSHSSEEIRLAIESFGDDYIDNQYIFMGLCSGSYISFHAAKDISNLNIAECVLINPLTFYWEEGMSLNASPAQNYSHWNWYKSAFKDYGSWLKLFKGQIAFKMLFVTLFNRLKVVVSSKIKSWQSVPEEGDAAIKGKNLNHDLLNIVSNQTQISFFLARNDPGYDIVMTSAGKTAKKLLKQGKMDMYFVEDADHTFSKYVPRCSAINYVVEHLSRRYSKNNDR